MHEQALARKLLEQANSICQSEGGQSLSGMRLAVGQMSGVELPLLESALRRMTTSDFVLQLECIPLVAECTACQHEFAIEAFHFICPRCRGTVRVTQGDRCELVSIDIETNEQDAPVHHPDNETVR